MANNLKKLIEALQELSKLEGHQFKSRAYYKAAGELSRLTEEEYQTRTNFMDIPGIGGGINDKILVFKSTGSIPKLNELRKDCHECLDDKLYKVRNTYVTRRISYNEAMNHVKYLEELYPNVKITYAGSLRREKDLIGDIDIIVSEEDYKVILGNLPKEYSVISSGPYKTSFMIDKVNNIQVDIIGVSEEEFPFQLLYLTGSKEFNIRMRARAKSFGHKLNQTGIWMNDKRVPGFTTEKHIFEFLRMEYVEPKDR